MTTDKLNLLFDAEALLRRLDAATTDGHIDAKEENEIEAKLCVLFAQFLEGESDENLDN